MCKTHIGSQGMIMNDSKTNWNNPNDLRVPPPLMAKVMKNFHIFFLTTSLIPLSTIITEGGSRPGAAMTSRPCNLQFAHAAPRRYCLPIGHQFQILLMFKWSKKDANWPVSASVCDTKWKSPPQKKTQISFWCLFCVLSLISLPHSLATLNQHPMIRLCLTPIVVAIPVDHFYCKLRPGFEGS